MKSAKGGAFEREVCKQLSLWWTKGARDDIFWRASNSGGRATVRRKKGLSTFGHCGDVAATDPIGQPLTRAVTIELKRGYTHSTVADVFDRPEHIAQTQFEGFIEQAVRAAENANTPFWMLVTRRNHRRAIVFFPAGLWNQLRENGAFEDRNTNEPMIKFTSRIRFTKPDHREFTVYGTPLDHFMKCVKRIHFI